MARRVEEPNARWRATGFSTVIVASTAYAAADLDGRAPDNKRRIDFTFLFLSFADRDLRFFGFLSLLSFGLSSIGYHTRENNVGSIAKTLRQNSFQTRHHSLYYLWHFIHPQGFLKGPQLVRSIWHSELCTSVKPDYVVDSPPTGSRISESLESGAGASSPRSRPIQCLSSLSLSLSLCFSFSRFAQDREKARTLSKTCISHRQGKRDSDLATGQKRNTIESPCRRRRNMVDRRASFATTATEASLFATRRILLDKNRSQLNSLMEIEPNLETIEVRSRFGFRALSASFFSGEMILVSKKVDRMRFSRWLSG